MGHLFNRRLLHPSNGHSSSNLSTRVHISLKAPWLEGLQTLSRMHLVSCQALPTPLIRRVNIQFPEASTDMLSTRRLNLSFQAILDFRDLSLCHIMGLLTTDLRITALPISLTMPIPHHNNNLGTEWATTWLVRVQITLCHLIMHLRTWLIDQCCCRACHKAYLREFLMEWAKLCLRIRPKACQVCRKMCRLVIICPITAILRPFLPSHLQEFRGG
jgi:hypothetical protein